MTDHTTTPEITKERWSDGTIYYRSCSCGHQISSRFRFAARMHMEGAHGMTFAEAEDSVRKAKRGMGYTKRTDGK